MKRRQNSGTKLQLSKETIRQLLSEDMLQLAAGGACPSMTGCSNTGYSLDECGSIYCSRIQM
jgi:hypothetical protein